MYTIVCRFLQFSNFSSADIFVLPLWCSDDFRRVIYLHMPVLSSISRIVWSCLMCWRIRWFQANGHSLEYFNNMLPYIIRLCVSGFHRIETFFAIGVFFFFSFKLAYFETKKSLVNIDFLCWAKLQQYWRKQWMELIYGGIHYLKQS